jgi:phosphoglycerate dehydrogenase-like enzyme
MTISRWPRTSRTGPDSTAEVEFVHRPIIDDDDLVKVLSGAEVVVAMRERTAFTAGRLARLPDLRLLVTTGRVNASIDVEAARIRRGSWSAEPSRPPRRRRS